MRPPPAATMLLGHPLVAGPVCLLTIGLLYAGWHGATVWPLVLILLPIGYVVTQANTARTHYLNWKCAWDGMASQPATPASAPGAWRPWAGGLMLAALALFLLANASDPTYAAALVWLLLAVAIAGTVAIIRRRKARPRPAKAEPVAVCVTRPLMPVPPLRDAYHAVPEHCRVLLGNGR